MNINVVTVSSGWILQKISERIIAANKSDFTMTMSHRPSNSFTANFYVDIQNCYLGKTGVVDVGLFTHLDMDSVSTLNRRCLTLDFIIHMCQRYYDVFSEFYPPEKMTVIHPYEIRPGFDLKKPTIGIVQRGFFLGKGYNFMLEMCQTEVMKKFKFLFVGNHWQGVVDNYKQNGIDVEYYPGENYDSYPSIYDRLDYLLIPSLWEGGPMSLTEAYATGTPVIASNVGWVPEYDVEYMFDAGSHSQLSKILESIYLLLENRRKKISGNSYSKYADRLVDIVKKTKGWLK